MIGLAPLAFLFGLLHARLLRSGVGDLVLELRAESGTSQASGTRSRARSAIRRWRSPTGCPTSTATPISTASRWRCRRRQRARAVTLIEREGAPVAALLHDPSLRDEPELLDSVTAAAGIALENARLQADLERGVEELAESRARVIDAGQKERQRLERNLHDGAQQRLVALSLDLGRLEAAARRRPRDQRRASTSARQQIAASLAELRDVARGIHPAVVSAHGLAVALEELAAPRPVPVGLTSSSTRRLPEPVEVAAYYVVCESLANIGKHAHATSATVTVARDDGQVVVEVVDDGVGGADTERGSGLRGLADRVEALGGRLRIWTPSGGGTRVRAEIPCES